MARALYLPLLAREREIEVTACCDINVQSGETVAAAYSARFSNDVEDVLTRDVHAAFILTPPWTHYDLVRVAIDRSIPAYVEKPLSLSSRDAIALHRKAEQTRSTVAVGYMRRFDPSVVGFSRVVAAHLQRERVQLDVQVDAGEWGRARLADELGIGSRSEVEMNADRFPYWLMKADRSKYLRIASQLIHELNLASTLVGPLSVIRVTSRDSDPRDVIHVITRGEKGDAEFTFRGWRDCPWSTQVKANCFSTEACLSLTGALSSTQNEYTVRGCERRVGQPSIAAFARAVREFLRAAAGRQYLTDTRQAAIDTRLAEEIGIRWLNYHQTA